MSTVEKIQSQIRNLSEHNLIELLEFIEFLCYKQVKKPKFSAYYDFSDLSGRLQWQGNALTEQKRLRNEW